MYMVCEIIVDHHARIGWAQLLTFPAMGIYCAVAVQLRDIGYIYDDVHHRGLSDDNAMGMVELQLNWCVLVGPSEDTSAIGSNSGSMYILTWLVVTRGRRTCSFDGNEFS